VSQILGMLQHFDLPRMGFGIDAVHFYAEACKLFYADRGLYVAYTEKQPSLAKFLIKFRCIEWSDKRDRLNLNDSGGL
jgi:gamma-glutamyltranspeptidase